MAHPIQESFCKRWFPCFYNTQNEVEKVNNEKLEKMVGEIFQKKRETSIALNTSRRHRKVDSMELMSVRTAFNWNPERLPRPKPPDEERSKSH
jgi:hypothetical protein